MANVVMFQSGGYRFITHAFQYSGGVAAEPGLRSSAPGWRECCR